MLKRIIAGSIEHKILVLAGVLAVIASGWWAMNQVPLDAVPDITNNQVQVVTVAPTSPPQEVEQQITFPVELAMQNLPNVVEVRSISRYGLSVVTVVFKEGFPLYDARQLVKEQIDVASGEIPDYLGRPEMMPITTGLGEIYQYVLITQPGYEGKYNLMDLRTIQDWIVKRQLGGTKGIIETSSFGGLLKQYEVSINPLALKARGLTFNDVVEKLKLNNQNSGGSYIEKDNSAYYIRTIGRAETIDEIENIVLGHANGSPILVSHVADVTEGASKRYGAMTMDGKGEVVGGITLMLKGANSSEAIANVHRKIAEIRKGLPEGVDIYPYLDRSELVSRTTKTVATNLIEGGLIVIFILILLLGNWRAGLIVASVIPLSMLFAFVLMYFFGVSANLMSLGAIDFGIIVDGAVIVVEGTLHYLGVHFAGRKLQRKEMNQAVSNASYSVMRPASFGVLIILVVFLPILTLEGVEGKMFQPMALTMSFALIGAFILSTTYVPAMSAIFLKRNISDKTTFSDRLIHWFKSIYRPALQSALRFPVWVVGFAGLLFAWSVFTFSSMGSEFVPTLDEGDLAMQMSIPPGSSLEESIDQATKAEAILLRQFPEVEHVISKIGTAEVPTDPMAIEEADIMIILKPRNEWESASDREALVEKMDDALSVLMGPTFEFTQPIQLRFNELMTGVKADIAIKVFGEDTEQLQVLAENAAKVIRSIPGAGDVKVEQTDGLQQLQVKMDRDALARYGVDVEDVNSVIRSAYAGSTAGQIFEGERRIDVTVRLKEDERNELNLRNLQVQNTDGQMVALSSLATVNMVTGPMQISREQAHRRINIGVNVRNRDIGSFIDETQSRLEEELTLPPGYFLQYGGQFENLQRASQRLMVAVPVALGLIMILLYLSFGNMKYALLIFTGIPFSAIGGVFALYLRDMPFSISAGVGFIALFGVAVLNGLVLINEFISLKEKGIVNMTDRIMSGSLTRMRPVIMTATVAALGFLPMALSTSSGAEVQRPLATVVIGGLVTSTFLTLFVLPIIYKWFEEVRRYNKSPLIVIGLIMLSIPPLAKSQTPITLDSAYAILDESHPKILSQELIVQSTIARQKQAWDIPVTELSLVLGQFNTGRTDNALGISQGIHLPGRYKRRERWLESLTSVEREHVEVIKLKLKKSLSEIYYEWMFYNDLEALWKGRNALWKEHLSRAKERAELGEDTGLSVVQAGLTASKINIRINELQAEKDALTELFNYFLGQDHLRFVPQVSATHITTAIADSLSRHPEGMLIQKELENEAARYQVAKTSTWPEFSIGWNSMTLIGETRSDDPTQEYSSGDRLNYFSVGVRTPFLFSHSRAERQEAAIAIEQKEVALKDWENHHRTQLEFWKKQVSLRSEALNNYESNVLTQAEELESSASRQMQSGLISAMEWTILVEQVFELQTEYVRKKWKLRQAQIELKYLTQEL